MEVWLVSSSTDPSPLQSDGSSSHSLPLATSGQVPPAQPSPTLLPHPRGCSAAFPAPPIPTSPHSQIPAGTPEDPSFPLPLQLLGRCWNRCQAKPKDEPAVRKPPGAHPNSPAGQGPALQSLGLQGSSWQLEFLEFPASGTGSCLLVSLAAQVAVLAAAPSLQGHLPCPGPGFACREQGRAGTPGAPWAATPQPHSALGCTSRLPAGPPTPKTPFLVQTWGKLPKTLNTSA